MIEDQIERHTGSLRKFLEAGSLDHSDMDEHVMATIVGHDEAETPGRVEPLHSSARHDVRSRLPKRAKVNSTAEPGAIENAGSDP
jgi:hypothetical protein